MDAAEVQSDQRKHLFRSLSAVYLFLSVFWLLGCQIALGAVLMSLGRVPTLCEAKLMPGASGLLTVAASYTFVWGLCYILLPAAILFMANAVYGRHKRHPDAGKPSAAVGMTGMLTMLAGILNLVVIAQPSSLPVWHRLLAAGLVDAGCLWVVWRAWRSTRIGEASPSR